MGDHFVLLVDRLLTESTLGAAIESRNRLLQASVSAIAEKKVDCSSYMMDYEHGSSSPRKLVECRICQDEDEDSNMEAPCSCCGSLKYAHRSCIQRWCNEKGNTMCEICQQQFKPGYTAPPPLFQFGAIPINLRGNWEISREDLNNPRFIAMVSTDSDFLDADYDEFSTSTSRNMMCCRSVAIIVISLALSISMPALNIRVGNFLALGLRTQKQQNSFEKHLSKEKGLSNIQSMEGKQLNESITSLNMEGMNNLFMILLILRHTLPVMINGAEEYSFPLFMLILLRTAGIILPIYVMLRAVTAIHRRRRQQDPPTSYVSTNEQTEPQTHIIRVQ